MPRRRDWLWLLAINVVVNIVADVTLNNHPGGIHPLEILKGVGSPGTELEFAL